MTDVPVAKPVSSHVKQKTTFPLTLRIIYKNDEPMNGFVLNATGKVNSPTSKLNSFPYYVSIVKTHPANQFVRSSPPITTMKV